MSPFQAFWSTDVLGIDLALLDECELPRLSLFSLQISYLNGSHDNVKKYARQWSAVENLLRHLLTYLAHNYT